MNINDECIITFDAKISSAPTNGFVSNSAFVEYDYEQPIQTFSVDSINTLSLKSSSSSSNAVSVSVIAEVIQTSKYCNRDVIKIGESAIFNIDIINTTSLDVVDLVLVDPIPSQFQVTDITMDGSSISGDLNTGINIGTLPSGMAKSIEITVIGVHTSLEFFNHTDIIAQFIPQVPGPPSYVNIPTISTNSLSIVNPNLSLFKSFSETDAIVGQTVDCNILVENIGNIELDNIVVYDLLTNDFEYIYSSLCIDGVKNNTQDIITGVKLESMIPNQSHIITFKLKVVGSSTNILSNLSNSSYTYKTCDIISTSNYGLLNISTIDLKVEKSASTTKAYIGDNIEYTITLKNTGNIDLRGVILKDKLPCLLTLIPQTFTVNGVFYNTTQHNLLSGFYIGDISPGQTITVVFSTHLRGTASTSGKPMVLDNIAQARFAYILPNGFSDFSTTSEVICRVNKMN